MRGLFLACVQLVGICMLALTPAPAAEALQKATLRLDWTALGYHAPFYLGVARRYYQDAGLDLAILEGKGSPAVASLVGNGSDDFGFADASTVAQLISQGLPEKVVMGIFQKSTLALYFPADRGIKSPADIRGKRIIVCPTDGMARYLPAFLKASGMTISDVKVSTVDCSIKYSYLAQGNGDLVGSYGTAGGSLLRAVGIENFGKSITPTPASYCRPTASSLPPRPCRANRKKSGSSSRQRKRPGPMPANILMTQLQLWWQQIRSRRARSSRSKPPCSIPCSILPRRGPPANHLVGSHPMSGNRPPQYSLKRPE